MEGFLGLVLDQRLVHVAGQISWGGTSSRLQMNIFGKSPFAEIPTTSGLEFGGGGS
jgi:hypothetical protein